MNDLIHDELHNEKVKLSAAVLRVCRLRNDLTDAIMHAHRDLVGQHTNEDPFVSGCDLTIALDNAWQNPKDKSYDTARLQMVDALLHIWYRVEPYLQGRVIAAVKEIAMLNGDDIEEAARSAYTVLERSRVAGTALKEQEMAHEAKANKTRAEREKAKLANMHKRLRNEAGVIGHL